MGICRLSPPRPRSRTGSPPRKPAHRRQRQCRSSARRSRSSTGHSSSTRSMPSTRAPEWRPNAKASPPRPVSSGSGCASTRISPMCRARLSWCPGFSRPAAARRGRRPLRPPRDGVLSMGIECNILPAAIEACRARSGRIIAVINDQMPYLYGDAQLPLDHVDLAIELSSALPEILPAPVDDDSSTIGELVAARVPNGATMQTGIGAIPDATLGQLTRHTGLRVWTETFSDGVLALDRGGALDQSHPLTASFLIGSRELYDWADGNPRVRMMRTERTNDPALIALQRSMTSINTALEMDLFGQANASRINARIYSGFGGQTDFIVGALHSVGGQAFMALRSWHPKADVSTIVPLIAEPVTSFQQSAVVTEHGVAELWGYSQQRQARHIIRDASHPRVRDELWEEAAELGLA